MSIRNFLRVAMAPIALAAALISCGAAFAQHDAMPAGAAGVKDEMLMWIQDAEQKLEQLAEAMPESKYGWSPDKGVRTVGDIFMHVAATNYGLPSFLGIKAPGDLAAKELLEWAKGEWDPASVPRVRAAPAASR